MLGGGKEPKARGQQVLGDSGGPSIADLFRPVAKGSKAVWTSIFGDGDSSSGFPSPAILSRGLTNVMRRKLTSVKKQCFACEGLQP